MSTRNPAVANRRADGLFQEGKSGRWALLLVLWALSAAQGQITVSSLVTNGLMEPFHLAPGPEGTVLVADSGNHRVLLWDARGSRLVHMAGQGDGIPGAEDGPAWEARFFNPQGVAWIRRSNEWGVLVADSGNHTLRFVRSSDGFVTTVAGIPAEAGHADGGPGASRLDTPVGLIPAPDGTVYVADSGNGAIRRYDPEGDLLETVTLLDGDTLRRPTAVVLDPAGRLWVADPSAHQVRAYLLTNSVEARLWTVLGTGQGGFADSTFGAAARFNGPRGLLWWSTADKLVIADANNHVIRVAEPYTLFGPTNYAVSTLAGTPGQNGFENGPGTSARFDTPVGLALDPEVETLLVADLKNDAIRMIQLGPALPPVQAPRIGWVDFVWDPVMGAFVTLLRTDDQPRLFNNEVYFAVLAERGVQVHYTVTNTPWPMGLVDYGETPSRTRGATAPEYRDGMLREDFLETLPVLGISKAPNLPGVVIKAVAFAPGRASSEVVTARYGFKAATPMISGQNFASFTVSSATVNPKAVIHYTVDGRDPGPSDPVVPEGGRLQLGMSTNAAEIVFRARAFAPNYLPSDISEKVFRLDDYVPTRISLGFTNGEGSSVFEGAPGQMFYAPVVLSLADETLMYSLQFQVTLTNESGPPFQGPMEFVSMLYEQVDATKGEKAPPGGGGWYRVIPPAAWSSTPTNRLFYRLTDPLMPLMDLTVYDPVRGFMAVGWLERRSFGNLYNTVNQDLISYSIARDNLLHKEQGRVILGAAAFRIPPNAASGDRYRIRVDRPSATSDGVGAPGAQVYIAAPTSGYLTNDGLSAERTIVMKSVPYLVGDSAPFRWLNAGDFGDGKLLNDDVMQVFETALYNFSPINPATGQPYDPPYFSDFRDALDAGPVLGQLTPEGYYVPAGAVPDTASLFHADDTLIDQIAFGDGVIDIVDVFITFRRSLDPARVWYERFWTNGQRVARRVPQSLAAPPIRAAGSQAEPPPAAWPERDPLLSFSIQDRTVAPGSEVWVPVKVRVEGRWPLRVLMASVMVRPLEGAPPLEAPAQFVPDGAWGQPTLQGQPAPGMVAFAWLDGNRPGVTGEGLLGQLRIRIPSGAPTGAVYRLEWGHVSGSPNGMAALPTVRQAGLVVVGQRAGSTAGDGIPDTWRLRYFGAVNSVLAAADADADGDGVSNGAEYRAGTDPVDAGSVLRLHMARGQSGLTIRWPARAGTRYLVERSGSLAGGWTPVGTITADSVQASFTDTNTVAGPRFYRVRVSE